MQRSDDLAGLTILVTGAGGGIGHEVVRELAKRGAAVVAGVRDPVHGAALAAELGPNAEYFAADVASPPSLTAAVRRLAQTHARLDVLINNAGVVTAKRTLASDGHEMTWATNVLGPYRLVRALAPLLRAAPAPRIVNVGSSAQNMGSIVWDDVEYRRRRFRSFPAYAASKLALMTLTRALAAREPGIAVSCVHPGALGTGIWRGAPAPIAALLRRFLPPAHRGAGPIIALATAADRAGVRGAYFARFEEKTPPKFALDDANVARLWELLGATDAVAATA